MLLLPITMLQSAIFFFSVTVAGLACFLAAAAAAAAVVVVAVMVVDVVVVVVVVLVVVVCTLRVSEVVHPSKSHVYTSVRALSLLAWAVILVGSYP